MQILVSSPFGPKPRMSEFKRGAEYTSENEGLNSAKFVHFVIRKIRESRRPMQIVGIDATPQQWRSSSINGDRRLYS